MCADSDGSIDAIIDLRIWLLFLRLSHNVHIRSI